MVSATELNALTAPFALTEQRRVVEAEMEALGYARGRVDACEDHHLPRIRGLDPVDFALSYAVHVATAIARVRDGRGASILPIRDHWEACLRGH
jgi:hypothetical protein